MPYSLVTLLGKTVRYAARLRGGGSALPGLFVERLSPDFVKTTLAQLPKGVIVVSGTNGKTTTTKMVVELLESQGLTVFTNKTGSNFSRGVAAALLGEIDMKGQLDADIAVLELDEAHGAQFVKTIKPRYSLLLNVMRDQLDRFGEIDATARLLHSIADATTDGIVVNRDDPRIGSTDFTSSITVPVRSFGVSNELLKLFPSDDDIRTGHKKSAHTSRLLDGDTSLEAIEESKATIAYGGKKHTVSLKLNGVYNILNATGAVALTRMVMGKALDESKMFSALANVTPAFGRGESIMVDGQPLELVLVKNPGGFRLGLKSFDPSSYATMIAINDNYADGRDMSWLWDVDFASLRPQGVAMISGIRAYDMALRLQYDEVEMTTVEPNLSKALRDFIHAANGKPMRVYCTYTAMLHLRKDLGKITNVEAIS